MPEQKFLVMSESTVSKCKAFERFLMFSICVCGLYTAFQYNALTKNSFDKMPCRIKELAHTHTLNKKESLTDKGNDLYPRCAAKQKDRF